MGWDGIISERKMLHNFMWQHNSSRQRMDDDAVRKVRVK